MDLSLVGMTNCTWWFKAFGLAALVNGALLFYMALRLVATIRNRHSRYALPMRPALLKYIPQAVITANSLAICGVAYYVVDSLAASLYAAQSTKAAFSYAWAFSDALDVSVGLLISLLPGVLGLLCASVDSELRITRGSNDKSAV